MNLYLTCTWYSRPHTSQLNPKNKFPTIITFLRPNLDNILPIKGELNAKAMGYALNRTPRYAWLTFLRSASYGKKGAAIL